MPGRHVDTDDEKSASPCRRCKERPSALVVRGDPLCRECFTNYVRTKAVKALDAFRVRNTAAASQRRVLLPVSFGVSSVSLLCMLDQHMERQRSRTGRVGFEIRVLHVDDSTVSEIGRSPNDFLAALKSRYPQHEYHLEPLLTGPEVTEEIANVIQEPETLLADLPSATSRADMREICLQKTVAAASKRLDCETVLWGHSTTRLAERILAETAKGRGFALPSLTKDGPSAFGMNATYPLRDVLKKELVSFAALVDPPLAGMCFEPVSKRTPVSSKSTTIDGLMKEYFESVETNYPGIVANVVRTTTKLEAPVSDGEAPCSICGVALPPDSVPLSSWAGEQQQNTSAALAPFDDHVNMCYGCARATQGSSIFTP